MPSIRFFHTADLHLDSPFIGLSKISSKLANQMKRSTFQAFEKLVDLAIIEKPDFLLIVGDLYDGEQRSLQAQVFLQKQLERLYENQIPVIISYGNHDHLGGKWSTFSFPPNVHIFDEEVSTFTFTVRNERVLITGFSYPTRHVHDSKGNEYPQADGTSIHIGMLHGSIAGNTAHAVYAPFTLEQLQEKQYDYWALGHIHKRQQLLEHPPVVYPGNIQSRHINETGAKGFYDVTLSKSHTELHFHETSVIHYEQIRISLEDVHHANELYEQVAEQLEQMVLELGALIVELTLEQVDSALWDEYEEDVWLSILQNHLDDQNTPIWISSINVHKQRDWTNHDRQLFDEMKESVEKWDDEQWRSIAGDVYNHPTIGRFLVSLNEEQKHQLTNESLALFEKLLLTKGAAE